MKQILLVDDDFLALNAFYSLTEWNRYNLQIAFEAHSGNEALSWLDTCECLPDVAFIDVFMPDMDGITLLQKIRERYPSMICFMLSSHSDYPYVRETLKQGAEDYFLKHEISAESIISALRSCGLVQNGNKTSVSPDEILYKAIRKEKGEGLSGYLLTAVCQDARPLLEAQRSSILLTCRHLLNHVDGALACITEENILVVLLAGDPGNEMKENAFHHATLLQKAMIKYHNVHFAFGPACYCADRTQIAEIYEKTRNQEKNTEAVSEMPFERDLSRLTLAVASGSRKQISGALESVFKIRDVSPGVRNRLLLAHLAHLREILGLVPKAYAPEDIPSDAVQDFFLGHFLNLYVENTQQKQNEISPAIRDALEFIDQHYAEDIQLSNIAQYCHLSYTHLSYLFKKETDENIIRYITRTRVYHAARMILFDGETVSAAAQSSGFNSYNRFVTTFRVVTGMTPSEFRKSPVAAVCERLLLVSGKKQPSEDADISE